MCIHTYVSNWPKRWVSNPLLIKIKKHLVKQSITTTLSNSFLVFQNLIVFSLENTHTHTHITLAWWKASFVLRNLGHCVWKVRGRASHPSYVHVKGNHDLAYASTWKSKYKTSTLYNLFKVAGYLQNYSRIYLQLTCLTNCKTQYMFCIENWKLHKKKVCNQILMPMTQVGSKLRFQQKLIPGPVWLYSRWREPMIWLGGEIWAHSWCCWKALDELDLLEVISVNFWTYDVRYIEF